ncbi:Pentatricopeptide repeat [Quillaja saponaria]|uniref:Pentatricopeptide repeat n=1 Tax=Quillaja saponaria TaxID=32244 RepID=A0AAD7QA74_QUISA|nr:Pentatricopeptide repeat [Quillaja saponaria]
METGTSITKVVSASRACFSELGSQSRITLFRQPEKSLPITVNQSTHIIPLSKTYHPVTNTTPYSELLNRQKDFHFNLFHQLKSPPDLSEARRLHGLLVVHGFFHPSNTNRVFGSQLVNVYVNFNCLQKAFVAFGKLPHKSNIAWNAILRGLVNAGQFSEAIEFYHSMLKQGIIPDNFTYPIVLKACSCLSSLEEGKRVQQTILLNEVRHNIKRNVYVECAMIDMYAKCGSLKEAHQLFEEMPIKDLACWSAMICGTVWNGEWLEALSLFRRMRLEGLHLDSVIVAAVLPVCGRLEAKQLGMALHGCAVKSGFETDLYISNALMDMYCKWGDVIDAHSIFCHMVHRDVVSWSTLIAGYSQNCLYLESFDLYLEMVNEGIETNAIIVASVLPALAKLKLLKQGRQMHTYALKQGLVSDMVVGSALIDMYSNCASIREAEHLFKLMSDKDILLWNSLIVGYDLNGELDSAFGIFRRIWKAECRPNHVTLLSILPMCTKMGLLKQGKEIHGYATRSGLVLMVSVGNSLIDMYSKCGYLELGLKVFNQLTMKNVVTYNTVISAHGTHGLGEQALIFFEQMKEARIGPNKVTLLAILSACSHAGLVDRGCIVYNSMINDYGIRPDTEHYSCMVDLLGRAGLLEDAYNFIRSMPVVPDANILVSILGYCRFHNDVKLAKLLVEHIFKMETVSSGCYVLLAKVYASCEQWKEMSNVRTLIRDKGLKVKPASSWIQVGQCVHIFHAESSLHPESDKIQETLDNLLFVIQDEGSLPDSSFFSNVDDHF